MNKRKTQRWVKSFFAVVLLILLLISSIVYVIDPFFQFRVKDNSYMLRSWFVGSGLIKNYDYDTLIIGSSMTQNFNMDVFRETLGVKPLHVGIGGMRRSEMHQLMPIAYEAEKAEQYYICVDINFFTDDDEESRYPQYLLKTDILSRLRYFFSYEVWFRYIPVDIGFMILDRFNIEMPTKFKNSKSIDMLEYWGEDFSYSEEAVLGSYTSTTARLTAEDEEALYDKMLSNIDNYLAGFDYAKGEHSFFFPPYSAVYWCDIQNYGSYEVILKAKQYFVEKASLLGAEVYDFQCADFITNLANYSDVQHYSPEINDYMAENFGKGDYLATVETVGEFQQKLTDNIKIFSEKYPEL